MNTQRQVNDFDFSKKLVQEPVVQDRKYSKAITNATSKIGNFINKMFKNTVVQIFCAALMFIFVISGLFSTLAEAKRERNAKEAAEAAVIEKNKAMSEKAKAEAQMQKAMAARNALIKKIAAVPQDEFAKMMLYVKAQLQVGEQVAARGLYAGDYMMKNRKTYNIDYALERKTNIIKYQREHEKFVYSRIVLLNDVYEAVKNNNTNDIEFTNLERFITWNNYYKNGEKYIDENLQAMVDHIVVNTDITDEINKKYPDPLRNN